MFTKEEKTEKICSFYASDYHLEMIMIPYINRKIDEKANVVIITEKSLKETIQTVISRVNLSENRKKEILNINWENNVIKNVKKTKTNQELIVFVIGSFNYIEKTNQEIIEKNKANKTKIINCYSLEDAQTRMKDIVMKHSKVLNTIEEKEIG